jgi:threonine/homoserine/homoserine lactone efflux protein
MRPWQSRQRRWFVRRQDDCNACSACSAGPLEGRATVGGHPLSEGFIRHVSNSKAILFGTALLPQFIVPGRPMAVQFWQLGVVGIAIGAGLLAQ